MHGHKQGRGNFQKKGMGTALLEAAEADARALGARGMAAWGVVLPFWMRASWFSKHGYRKADKLGMMALMWKPFTADAAAPSWIRPKKKTAARGREGGGDRPAERLVPGHEHGARAGPARRRRARPAGWNSARSAPTTATFSWSGG